MRLNYYRFPEGVPEDIRLKEGCAVRLKTGGTVYVDEIPEDKRHLVDFVNDCIGGLTVTRVKQLMKQYGGIGFTEHIDRDGSVFEMTEIQLKGNNSLFKYNRHL